MQSDLGPVAVLRWAELLHVGAGVGATLACLHGLVLVRTRDRRLAPIVGFATLSAVFCVLGADVRQLVDPERHLSLFKVWVACGMSSAVLWPWVVRAFVGLKPRGLPIAISAVWTVMVVLQLLLPYGLTLAGPGPIELAELPALGIAEHQLRGAPPPWGPVLILPPLLLWAYLPLSARALYRAGRKLDAVLLFLGALPQVLATMYDAVVSTTVYKAPYFSDFGFLFFGFVLTAMMAGKLADDARMKEAVERSEQRLRGTLAAMEDAVFTIDARGVVVEANPAATRLTRLPGAWLRGKPFDVVVSLAEAEGPSPARAIHRRVLVRSDHTRATVLRTTSELTSSSDAGGQVIVLRDVTDHEQLEARVRRQQSMEALGQLAGGVAHDFNNMLTGIMGAASLLGANKDGSTNRRYVDLIVTTAERAAQLSGRLLSFSRRGRLAREVVSLEAIVRDVVELLRRTIDPRIEICLEGSKDRDLVEVDAGEIHSAVLNLGLNARDAMPEGGTLTFRLSRQQVTHSVTNRFGFTKRAGSYVCLEVIDTGSGISDVNLDRIFEPFFTTKELGRGSGMGLAAVWGAIAQLGGAVDVTSRLAQGSQFTLMIPETERAVAARRSSAPSPPKRSGHVLVADDEASVRTVCIDTLRAAGFDVSAAPDGEAALLALRNDASISVVLLDVRMPKLTGLQVLEALGEGKARLRFVVMTGFVGDDDVSAAFAEPGLALLRKPFTSEALLAAVSAAAADLAASEPRPWPTVVGE